MPDDQCTAPDDQNGEDPPNSPDEPPEAAALAKRGDQTTAVERLTNRERPGRRTIGSDTGTPALGASQQPSSALPGSDAFGAISGVAPFLALARLYAECFYGRRKSAESRMDAFTKDHKWIVRVAFFLDLVIRLVLVLIVLRVVLKGVSPLPELFEGGWSWI